MSDPRDDDALLTRYREASNAESRQPSARVREAVLAHARMVIEANARRAAAAPVPATPLSPAANQPRFRWSMVASVAVVGLAGLLALQLDRGSPEQKELAMGQRPANVPPAAPAPASTAKEQGPENPVAVVPAQPVEAAKSRSVIRPSAATAPTLSTANPESPRDELASRDKAAAPSMSGFQEKADSRPAMAPPSLPSRQAAARADAPPVDRALALRAAASTGAMAELERLLSGGAALNAPDDAGRTALMLASMQGHAEVVQRLLAAGANAALQDRDGLTALMHARRLKLDRITSLLEARH